MSRPSGGPRPFLVVTEALPVYSSGTSIIVRRLLENFGPEEVVLIGRNPDASLRVGDRPPRYPMIRIPSLPPGIRGERYWRLLSTMPGVLTGLRAIRRYRPTSILAVFPYESSLLTGYWLHLLTGLPLLSYFCDLYREDVRIGWEAPLAAWLQPRVFRASRRLLVISEGMREYYRDRYGLDAVCVPVCINNPIPRPEPAGPPSRPFIVGYSGNINTARLSSLRALVRAIGGDSCYEMRYFTPQSPESLRTLGVWAPNATATFVKDEADLVRLLGQCDVLFLPLTFEVGDQSQDQLATCFGTKSSEYLVGRKPILLHCPGDYFMARFYKRWDCGLVVDDPDTSALRSGLERLRMDAPLRDRLVRNALRAAHEFEGPRVASAVRSLLPGADTGARAPAA
jgi:glycosyltransferase involved in cell wall biosynthesis